MNRASARKGKESPPGARCGPKGGRLRPPWGDDAVVRVRRSSAPSRRSGPALVERRRMELLTGLEPVTSSLPRKCSTTELQQQGIHPRAPVGRPGLSARRARQGQRPRGGGASSDSPGRGRGRGRAEVERVGGIEPPCAAWKAAVLPLNYTRQWVPPLPQEHARPGVCRRPQGRRAVGVRARGRSRSAALLQEGGSTAGRSPTSAVHGSPRRPASASPCSRRSMAEGMVGEAGFEPAKAEPSDLQSDPFDRSGIPPWTRPEPPERCFGARGPPTRRPVQSRVHRRRSRLRPGPGPAGWVGARDGHRAPVSSSNRIAF